GIRVHNDSLHLDTTDRIINFDDGSRLLVGTKSGLASVEYQQDLNGDGFFEKVTGITKNDGVSVSATFTHDGHGVVEGDVEYEVIYGPGSIITGNQIGSIFGSTLGQSLAGDNIFAQIAAGSVLGAVMENLGESLDVLFNFAGHDVHTVNNVDLADSTKIAFDDFGADLFNQVKTAGIGAISSFLAGELGEAIGLDSGFEGQLFQTVAGRTIGTVANTVVDNIAAGNADIFNGLSAGNLAAAGLGAVATFTGGYLAREIVTAQSQAGAIGGSIGGAIGSTVGAGIAGVGFLGSTLGSAAVGSAFGTAFGVSIGAIILPGVGAFVGTILGTLLGDVFDDLFGGGGHAKGTYNVSLDFERGLYYESGTDVANGGHNEFALARSLGERTESILNAYIEMMGGENANSHSPTVQFYNVNGSSSVGGLHVHVFPPQGHGATTEEFLFSRVMPDGTVTGEAVDKVVEDAVLAAIKAVQIKGGDIYLKRAVLNSEANDLRDFAGDLQIAEDYRQYLQDKPVIDALIAEEPNSTFSAGWLITLLRAEELGLTTWQESDFYGGLEGLLLSLDVEASHGISIEDVAISVVTETLADGSQRKDLVLKAGAAADAETIARINGFEAAAGFTHVETGTAGTAGKDIWLAAAGGATFDDTAGHEDEHSHDILIGGDGADTINGGAGWDFIRGGGGNDVLNGGGA
ncbi:MAG: hypothetical protein AAF441_24385, partial [Pseudomonadota bacterium]